VIADRILSVLQGLTTFSDAERLKLLRAAVMVQLHPSDPSLVPDIAILDISMLA